MKVTIEDVRQALAQDIVVDSQLSTKTMKGKQLVYSPLPQMYLVIREDLASGCRKISRFLKVEKALEKYNSIIIKETPHEIEQTTSSALHRREV